MREKLCCLDPTSTTISARGAQLHIDVWHGGHAEQVLLLHGLGGNTITWHGVAPRIAVALRARVVALDLPGFGTSRPGVDSLGMDMLADLTREVLRAQALGNMPWRLCGNSLGGVLALNVACSAPELVRSVALAAPALPLAWGRSAPQLVSLLSYLPAAIPWLGRRLVARQVRATGVPGVVDRPVQFLFGDPARLDPVLRARLIAVSVDRLTWADEAARALEQTTRSLGVSLLSSEGARRWIQQVTCPVLVIHGGSDPLYPPEAWEYLEQLRPDWSHRRMHGVGHVPQLEAPGEFARHVLEHW